MHHDGKRYAYATTKVLQTLSSLSTRRDGEESEAYFSNKSTESDTISLFKDQSKEGEIARSSFVAAR
jgi:hypothetical protein